MTEPPDLSPTGVTRRLLLVGGGLAHLHVLHGWRRRAPAGVELVLIAPSAHWHYSGMVPGFLHDGYPADALRVDLAELARCAGARFIQQAADRVIGAERVVHTGTEQVAFDLCSIDVGSGIAGADIPGVTAHTIPLRPMSRALELRARLDTLMDAGAPVSALVVGAGAGGVEVALAIQALLTARGAVGTVTLVNERQTVLAGESAALRTLVATLLGRRGVGMALGGAVTSVNEAGLTLVSGATVPANVIVWTTGSAPPTLLARSDLPLDEDGFLRVDAMLHAAGDAPVWGAGDCVRLDGQRRDSAGGAIAVRQGPVLLHNLRMALTGGRARRFRAPPRTLAILDTADGRAIARWGSVQHHGPLAWRLKQYLDRRFVGRLRAPCDESMVRAG